MKRTAEEICPQCPWQGPEIAPVWTPGKMKRTWMFAEPSSAMHQLVGTCKLQPMMRQSYWLELILGAGHCSLVQTPAWGIRVDGYRAIKNTQYVLHKEKKTPSVDLRVNTGKFPLTCTPGWHYFRQVDTGIIVVFLGLLLECRLSALMVSCCNKETRRFFIAERIHT